MKCFIGIDLGSTTTKAILMDENKDVLGRGITNSRSNYDTAAAVSKQEAYIDARFTLLRRELNQASAIGVNIDEFLQGLERNFRREQFLEQLKDLATENGKATMFVLGDSESPDELRRRAVKAARRELAEAGVALYPDIERAARTLGRYVEHLAGRGV